MTKKTWAGYWRAVQSIDLKKFGTDGRDHVWLNKEKSREINELENKKEKVFLIEG